MSYDLLVRRVYQKTLKPNKEEAPVTIEDDLLKVYDNQAVKYFISPIPFTADRLKLVRKIAFTKTVKEALLTRVIKDGQLSGITYLPAEFNFVYLYEITKALPRTRFVYQTKVIDTQTSITDQFTDSSFDPNIQVLVGEKLKDFALGKTKAELIDDIGDKIVVKTSGDEGWLYLADTFYPGWSAYIDGIETNIYPANYSFKIISVPKGDHEVVFVYDPQSKKAGFAISAVGLSIFTLLVYIWAKQKKDGGKQI
jgi:hypothetical protein